MGKFGLLHSTWFVPNVPPADPQNMNPEGMPGGPPIPNASPADPQNMNPEGMTGGNEEHPVIPQGEDGQQQIGPEGGITLPPEGYQPPEDPQPDRKPNPTGMMAQKATDYANRAHEMTDKLNLRVKMMDDQIERASAAAVSARQAVVTAKTSSLASTEAAQRILADALGYSHTNVDYGEVKAIQQLSMQWMVPVAFVVSTSYNDLRKKDGTRFL